MDERELQDIEDKVNWSGYDRETGKFMILKLLGEIRRLKTEVKQSNDSPIERHLENISYVLETALKEGWPTYPI